MIIWEPGVGAEEPAGGDIGRRPGRWQPAGEPKHRPRRETLRWTRRFAGTPEQVGAARRFVAHLLADGDDAGEAAWVASELATNAICYSRSGAPGGSFEVQVMRCRPWADVRVIDAGGGGTPAVLPPQAGDGLSERGRGLYAIGFLATRYGTYVRRDGHRVVWVRLPATPRAVVGTCPPMEGSSRSAGDPRRPEPC